MKPMLSAIRLPPTFGGPSNEFFFRKDMQIYKEYKIKMREFVFYCQNTENYCKKENYSKKCSVYQESIHYKSD